MNFLSPGKWHTVVPKDLEGNLRYRVALLEKCNESIELREAVKLACSQDLLFWTNSFVWQFNAMKPGKEVGPFITYDWQDEAMVETMRLNVDLRQDVVWEKSRGVGGTVMDIIIDDWLCRFHNNKIIPYISHTKDAVDKSGDPSSLLWKLEFIDRWLPDWLKQSKKQTMGIQYPQTDSAIMGYASTGRASVGGRGAKLTLDEVGLMQNAGVIVSNTQAVGPRLYISTHYGVGTEFYHLARKTFIKKFVFHWSMHPDFNKGLYRYDKDTNQVEILDKDYKFPPDYEFITTGHPTGGYRPGVRSPWYDAECRRANNDYRKIAMHLDIDPEGSGFQVFNPLMIRERQSEWCCDPAWEGTVAYDSVSGEFKSFVKRQGGHLKLWMHLGHQGPPAGKYCMACDLSLGRGATPSVLSICNASTGMKVGELADANIDPASFAVLVKAIGHAFHDALLVWERNGPGDTFGAEVMRTPYGYSNVWRTMKDMPHTFQPVFSDMPGWNPTPGAKRELIADYQVALERGAFVNPSKAALEECLGFEMDEDNTPKHAKEKSKDPRESKVNHGDRVWPDALCNKMRIYLGGSRNLKITDVEDRVPIMSMKWRFERAAAKARRSNNRWVSRLC